MKISKERTVTNLFLVVVVFVDVGLGHGRPGLEIRACPTRFLLRTAGSVGVLFLCMVRGGHVYCLHSPAVPREKVFVIVPENFSRRRFFWPKCSAKPALKSWETCRGAHGCTARLHRGALPPLMSSGTPSKSRTWMTLRTKSSTVKSLSSSTFLLRNLSILKLPNKLLIVFFSIRWCGPCRLLTPRIESVIAEKNGKVHLAKVDIDELTDLALEYDVIQNYNQNDLDL
jgi:thiol-disulfide isomerase/thioredoxin